MNDQRTRLRWGGRMVLALALIGMYAPMVMVFLYSFNESRIGAVWSGFSIRWYVSLWERSDLWSGLWVSLIVGVMASSISVILGLLAALGAHQWQSRSRRLASGLLTLPLVIPDIILAISLALFFHAIDIRQGLATVVLAHTAFGVSYAFVVLYAAVQDFDETLYWAAVDCGARPWQAFWYVIFPLLTPSMLVAWLLVFAVSFDDFLITFFTKGPGDDTLPIKIFSQIRFGVRPDTNALFVVLFLITLLGATAAWWVHRRWEDLRQQSSQPKAESGQAHADSEIQ